MRYRRSACRFYTIHATRGSMPQSPRMNLKSVPDDHSNVHCPGLHHGRRHECPYVPAGGWESEKSHLDITGVPEACCRCLTRCHRASQVAGNPPPFTFETMTLVMRRLPRLARIAVLAQDTLQHLVRIGSILLLCSSETGQYRSTPTWTSNSGSVWVWTLPANPWERLKVNNAQGLLSCRQCTAAVFTQDLTLPSKGIAHSEYKTSLRHLSQAEVCPRPRPATPDMS